MFIFTVFSPFMLFCICLANKDHVAQYTDSDFSTNMTKHETALVMFYAPWCELYKNLKLTFAKAAKELGKNDPPVALIEVDCSGNGKITCDTYDVTGYPALKIFRNGKLLKSYLGPRDEDEIVRYMKMKAGPSSKEFTELLGLESYLASGKLSIVGFFQKDTDLKKAFLKSADELREKAPFAHTSSPDALEKYEVSDDILLFRPLYMRNEFEEDSVKFSGNASVDAINDFILINYHGLVDYRVRDNRHDFKTPNVIAYYPVDLKKNPKGTNYVRNRMLKVAKQYQDKITFAISPLDELKEHGLIPFKGKAIVFARQSNTKTYKMEDDFSVEALAAFVFKFSSKKLKPQIKSEKISKTNGTDVKIAVAKNFDKIVTNNKKDVLIVFYSPRCAYCKRISHVFEDLAFIMKYEGIAVVKMDATRNKIPSPFLVDRYPTIYWIPKYSKDKPIKYKGGHKLMDFIKYIAKHATNELKHFDRKGRSR